MKYLQKRNNTYYYRRRVPLALAELSTVKVIYRPLSTDMKLAVQLTKHYDSLFNMIDLGIKLKQDITDLIAELNLPTVKKIDVYQSYLKNQDVSSTRIAKIKRLLSVIRVLMPKDLKRLNMSILDVMRNQIIFLPKRNIQKYKNIEIQDLIKMNIPTIDKLSTETANDHLKTLNSLLKFAYERDTIPKPYAVSMAKKTTNTRDERMALPVDTIRQAIDRAKTATLASSFTLLYLTGLRPSEVYKCKVTVVNGIKCLDLTDKSLQLKTKGSHRLIPVHHSITEPEKILEDYRSMSSQYISRQFKVEEGTLYSLRHSFATHLASKGIEPYIISELLGHTHDGMTMGRYVKGLPIKLLSESINKLEPV